MSLMLISCQTSESIEEDPLVKKSIVGFCHSMGSISYQEITRYTPFNSIEACVESGGKLPASMETSSEFEVPGLPTPPEIEEVPIAEPNLTEESEAQIIDSENPPFKKSGSNICHEQGSRFYALTKKFEPFGSLEECLSSGGRLPGRKQESQNSNSSTGESESSVKSGATVTGGRSVGGVSPSRPSSDDQSGPQVKKSDSDICHERGTRFYPRTKLYTSYDSIDECLKSGGRLPKRQ